MQASNQTKLKFNKVELYAMQGFVCSPAQNGSEQEQNIHQCFFANVVLYIKERDISSSLHTDLGQDVYTMRMHKTAKKYIFVKTGRWNASCLKTDLLHLPVIFFENSLKTDLQLCHTIPFLIYLIVPKGMFEPPKVRIKMYFYYNQLKLRNYSQVISI